ncbi:hypothetical protein [Xylanimonas oleitrophica]|uniref:hypothetical protein n=1 Tax=Xylanimonas oleitrophica TaxID=2607479 RepID=UPI0011B49B56|nr:hypothetical protein [Xylanimonas oleitrophica]
MSALDRMLAAVGLQRARTDAEQAALDRLAACTTGPGDYLHRLEQAVMIAQCGGVDDDTLVALLHLAAAGQMTPGVERALAGVGIDLTPRPTTRPV